MVVSSKSVGDAAKADVTLDKSFIDSIVKDTNAKLTIKTPFGDKTYTQDELKAMSEAATGSTVTVAIEKAARAGRRCCSAKIAKAKSIVKDMKLVARSSKTAKKNIKAVLKSDAQDQGFHQGTERPRLHRKIPLLSLDEESGRLQGSRDEENRFLHQHKRQEGHEILTTKFR